MLVVSIYKTAIRTCNIIMCLTESDIT